MPTQALSAMAVPATRLEGSLEILIPTVRPTEAIEGFLREIKSNTRMEHRIIVSSGMRSAAANRNRTLRSAQGELVVMIDDDIAGFWPGWEMALLEPLLSDSRVCMVGARLMAPSGAPGVTCAKPLINNPAVPYVTACVQPSAVLPSAAIAFRNIGLRFDEGYVGSGFEDSDFCFQYLEKMPGCRFVIANCCPLIHYWEQKNQAESWATNERFLHAKWARPGVRKGQPA